MDSAGRLSTLVSNMLMLSKLEQQTTAVETAPFWLDEQIRQVLVGLEPLWGPKDVQLEVDLPPVKFNGSESLLYHVWSNLLSNAAKFSPRGEVLQLRLLVDDDPLLAVEILLLGQWHRAEGIAQGLLLHRG